ncbi:hypothetical protein V6N13_133341 [Hibiscus sabdariffa]|uniref:Uncharacterized protein n=1 Tax=Hibiscus sabdariffa TaxID=183260 RepID=A0ABR2CKQ6_9ROSI
MTSSFPGFYPRKTLLPILLSGSTMLLSPALSFHVGISTRHSQIYILPHTSIPPLTPPPSYYSNFTTKPIKNKRSRSGLLQALFPKLISLKKTTNLVPSSPSSSSLFLAVSPRKVAEKERIFEPR